MSLGFKVLLQNKLSWLSPNQIKAQAKTNFLEMFFFLCSRIIKVATNNLLLQLQFILCHKLISMNII